MSVLDSSSEHKQAMEVAKRVILATRQDENVEVFFFLFFYFVLFFKSISFESKLKLKEVTEAFASLVIVHLIINQSTHFLFFLTISCNF